MLEIKHMLTLYIRYSSSCIYTIYQIACNFYISDRYRNYSRSIKIRDFQSLYIASYSSL